MLQWRCNRALRHFGRQPIGCVVLAEAMPLFAIDKRLVKRLHHVAFDLREAEAAHVRHDLFDKLRAFGIGDDPVEEIAFDGSGYSRACERVAESKSPRVVLVEAEHGEGDAFRDDHQIRVLQPQGVSLNVAAVDNSEKLRPKLSLEKIPDRAADGP